MHPGQRLCRADAVAEGDSRGLDPDEVGQDLLLILRTGGQLRLYRDACPHQGVPMAWRKDAYLNGDATRVVCYAHGAQFEPDTGLCVLGPCLGESLQPVAFEVDAEGWVLLAARR